MPNIQACYVTCVKLSVGNNHIYGRIIFENCIPKWTKTHAFACLRILTKKSRKIRKPSYSPDTHNNEKCNISLLTKAYYKIDQLAQDYTNKRIREMFCRLKKNIGTIVFNPTKTT